MTNKEGNVDIDEIEDICDSHLVALLAVQLVRQVLEEAYVIANETAETTGQPWRISVAKNSSSESIEVEDEENSYAAYKDDCEDNGSNHETEDVLANNIITSTPQKIAGEIVKVKIDANKIGQGDEEIDMVTADLFVAQDNDFNSSTATFINHLFDMSEVEKVIICDDSDFEPSNIQSNTFPSLENITQMMESYVNTALSMAFVTETQDIDLQAARESSRSTDYSGYSFLCDAFDIDDIGKEVVFLSNDGNPHVTEETQAITPKKIKEMENVPVTDEQNPEDNDEIQEDQDKNNRNLFENAYLTLNRDEQCSDEEEPVLLDPKEFTMQEVELLTANTSEHDIASDIEKIHNEMAATSAVSAVSRKSLVHRCRSQGSRLLACLRGWWRRKTPGRRKEARVSGSIRGICPLSPDARLRATSMLDQRRLRSPSPNHSVVWKFNTVNEALVNSSRWKEYTFNVRPDECGEF